MREETLKRIEEEKIIVIVRGLAPEKLEKLVAALYEGGIRLMEITFAQAQPDTWKDTAAGIKMIAEKYAGRMLVGAGTVISMEQLQMAYEAGAKYIISPNTDVEVIKKTRELGLVSLPGAFSPSEIVVAHDAGADMVKVFPAADLGPGYIKAVKGPLAHIDMLAVGGVDEKNIKDFISNGAKGAGVGGSLVKKDLINEGKYDQISKLAAEFVSAVK